MAVTAARVSMRDVARMYRMGPTTEVARLIKPKNEKNSPLREDGVI